MKTENKQSRPTLKINHEKSQCPSFLINSPTNRSNINKSSKNLFLNINHLSTKQACKSVQDPQQAQNRKQNQNMEIQQINNPDWKHRSLRGSKVGEINFASMDSSKQQNKHKINQFQDKKSYQDQQGAIITINIKVSNKNNQNSLKNKKQSANYFDIGSPKRRMSHMGTRKALKDHEQLYRQTKSVKNLYTRKSSNSSQNSNRSQLQDYTFIELLGHGATAKVHLVRHNDTNGLYALKMINKQLVRNLKIQENIIREIKNTWKVQDANIIKLYDVFDDNHHIYLLMEYLSEGTLYDKWIAKRKIMNQKIVSRIVGDICKGLKALHNNEIIHRDLKLENILLQSGVAKIADLGCSVQTIVLRKSIIGSPNYLSPQQLTNHFYNQKIDIWSLGIMTFQLLFGYSPYEKDIYEIFVKKDGNHVLPDFKFPTVPAVSQDAHDFLQKTLQKKFSKRMNARQALSHPFLTKNLFDYKDFYNICC